jgi:hypothetical protein
MVAEEATWQLNLLSLVNFAFSASRKEKSELLVWLDKHDFAKPDTMTQSIALLFKETSVPLATTYPGRELS